MTRTIAPIALNLSSKLHTDQEKGLPKQQERKTILGLAQHQRFSQKLGTTGMQRLKHDDLRL